MAELHTARQTDNQELNTNWVQPDAMRFCCVSRKAEVKNDIAATSFAKRMTAYLGCTSVAERYGKNMQLFIPFFKKACTPAVRC